jgi:hypothetical protein
LGSVKFVWVRYFRNDCLKMKSFRKFGYAFASLLVVCLLSLPAVAQKGKSGSAAPPPAQNNKNTQSNNSQHSQPNNQNNKPANLREAATLPPKFIEKLEDMSPEQRERFMQNNERFKNMSPQRQAEIKQHLQQWNNMTPQQRIQWREQQQALESMTPVEQRYVRQEMLPQLRAMAPVQRQFLRQHVRQLEGLSDSDRDVKLHDPAFLQGLSPDEQKMLPYLSRLHWAGVVEAPPPTPPGN